MCWASERGEGSNEWEYYMNMGIREKVRRSINLLVCVERLHKRVKYSSSQRFKRFLIDVYLPLLAPTFLMIWSKIVSAYRMVVYYYISFLERRYVGPASIILYDLSHSDELLSIFIGPIPLSKQ